MCFKVKNRLFLVIAKLQTRRLSHCHVAGTLSVTTNSLQGGTTARKWCPSLRSLPWPSLTWVTRQPWQKDTKATPTLKAGQWEGCIVPGGPPPPWHWPPVARVLVSEVFVVQGLQTSFPHLEAPVCPDWRNPLTPWSSTRRDQWEPQQHAINTEDQHNSTQASKIRWS